MAGNAEQSAGCSNLGGDLAGVTDAKFAKL